MNQGSSTVSTRAHREYSGVQQIAEWGGIGPVGTWNMLFEANMGKK